MKSAGRVAFGGLTGADVKLNIQSLYSKQIKLIGSTGGSRKEFRDIINLSKELKVRVWKRFKLENAKEANLKVQQRIRLCMI
jgi:D-arabinose 1-dehydrogenase-like Zn-dependent alcohol dehydrogenase